MVLCSGPSAILYPTAQDNTSTQWHLVNDDGSYPNRLEKIHDNILVDLEALQTKRTFLGYCGTAHICLGTNGLNNVIQRSAAQIWHPRPELTLTGLNLNIGKPPVSVDFQLGIALRNGATATLPGLQGYEALLKRFRDGHADNKTLLYDISKGRG